jgi:hypothetical protein
VGRVAVFEKPTGEKLRSAQRKRASIDSIGGNNGVI